MDKRIEKLPKWAKLEITRLQNDLEEANRKLAEFQGEKETDIYIREGLDLRPLPKKSSIEFHFGKG